MKRGFLLTNSKEILFGSTEEKKVKVSVLGLAEISHCLVAEVK